MRKVSVALEDTLHVTGTWAGATFGGIGPAGSVEVAVGGRSREEEKGVVKMPRLAAGSERPTVGGKLLGIVLLYGTWACAMFAIGGASLAVTDAGVGMARR